MYPLIDTLITKHRFALESWDDRYSKGVWAVFSPSEHLTGDVMAASSDGDSDMIPATEYILGTDWLPVVTDRTFLQSMAQLEARLAALPPTMIGRNTIWADAVSQALTHLRDVRRESKSYGGTDGMFTTLTEHAAQMFAMARTDHSDWLLEKPN